MSDKITTVLWFDRDGKEAAEFYVSLLPDSRIDQVIKSPADNPSMQAGGELVVDFTLAGRKYSALNGGPTFKPNESVSFMVITEDQAETNRLWHAVVGHGGRKAHAAGARTNGDSVGRSRRGSCSNCSPIPILRDPNEVSRP